MRRSDPLRPPAHELGKVSARLLEDVLMGRYERESLASEAQRLALISEIRMRLLDAFYGELSGGPAADAKLRQLIDSVLNDYR